MSPFGVHRRPGVRPPHPAQILGSVMSADHFEATDADLDFDVLYKAVSATPRGRWFIEEFLKRAGSANTQVILDAIADLKQQAGGTGAQADTEVLRRELQEMSKSISHTRDEIAAIQPTGADGNSNNRILEATGELDGIVTATERATGDILGAAENIQTSVDKLRANEIEPHICDEIEAQIMDVFTACSFQDITGQRITKVVNVLRYLEQRVNTMINVWGVGDEDDGPILAPGDDRPDAHLLHGPQSEGAGHDQDAIDELMAGFDTAEPALETDATDAEDDDAENLDEAQQSVA